MRLVNAMIQIGLLCAASSAALAQDDVIGAELYRVNCAVCHGASGKGDGDMASVLTIPAPNLTLLAKANDGVFPMLKVIHVIDGRTGLRGHGNPMPVFASAFGADLVTDPKDPYGPVLEARGKVMSVALYLEQLQN